MAEKGSFTYKDAGVDIHAGESFVKRIREDIELTELCPGVISTIGSFSGLLDLREVLMGKKLRDPILVQVVQGFSVNTSNFTLFDIEQLGRSILYVCLKPFEEIPLGKRTWVSFLDYLGVKQLSLERHVPIVRSLARWCRGRGIPIIGGETAELPVILNDDCLTLVGVLTVLVDGHYLPQIKGTPSEVITFGLSETLTKYQRPVLAQTIDGIGTKSKERLHYSHLMRDLVNHCANDMGVSGAKPLFMSCYADANTPFELSEQTEIAKELFFDFTLENGRGIFQAHPNIFQDGQVDLVCAASGIVEYDEIINGRSIKHGDVLLGLPSAGLHTNGFSLARKILLEQMGLELDEYVQELHTTVREELLKPHLNYLPAILALNKERVLKGAAHITGGGIPGNLVRILPPGCRAIVRKEYLSPLMLPIFKYLQESELVSEEEMFRTFNMGVGMVLVVAEEDLNRAAAILKRIGQKNCFIIGKVYATEKRVEII